MTGADIGAVAVAPLRVLGGMERPGPTQLWGSICRWKCCSGGRNPCLARDRRVSFTELLSILPMSSVVYLKFLTARSGDVLLTKCGNAVGTCGCGSFSIVVSRSCLGRLTLTVGFTCLLYSFFPFPFCPPLSPSPSHGRPCRARFSSFPGQATQQQISQTQCISGVPTDSPTYCPKTLAFPWFGVPLLR
jgi:hypothetical protein